MVVKEKDDIDSILNFKVTPDVIRKEVKIQHSGKQFSIKIPLNIVEELGIKKGDIIIFEYDTNSNKYSIKLKK